MNGLERLLAAVRLEATDRVPFVPQLFGHAALAAGVGLVSYLHDGRVLAECQLRERQRFDSDAVFAFADFGVETEALGSRLKFYDRQYPDVADYALGAGDDPARLAPPDPVNDGRMPTILRAVALLRRALQDTAVVAGAVTGPMTLATQLYGTEAALYLAADDIDRFQAALELATATALRFGRAQLAAGAHGIVVFDPAASPAVVPPSFFAARVQPRLQRLLAGLRAGGARLVWLNIAGPTAPILPHYETIGADIATFDYYVECAQARRLLPRTCLAGNLRSLAFLDPAPAALAAAARQSMAAFADRGGYLLSSGCEIPPEAGDAGIAAVAAAARSDPGPCRA